MIIILYIFLGLCAFFIGLPLALLLLRVALVAISIFIKRIGEKAKIELQLMNLEQCRNCKYNGWLYDKERPTGDDARYHNGAKYGVCCEHGARFLLDSTFIEDPGDKCKNYEKKDEVKP